VASSVALARSFQTIDEFFRFCFNSLNRSVNLVFPSDSLSANSAMRLLLSITIATMIPIGVHAQPPLKKEPAKLPFEVLDLGGHVAEVRGVALTADNKLAVTASMDRTIRIWNVDNGEVTRTIRLPLRPWSQGVLYALAISPNGQTIAAAGWSFDQGREGNPIYLIASNSGRLLATLLDHTDVITGLAFSSDGGRLASASLDRSARIWNLKNNEAETVLRGHTDGIVSIAFSPDGKRIATAANDRTIRVWPIEGIRSVFAIKDASPYRVTWSPDGRGLASVNIDGTATIWDINGKKLWTHEAPEKRKVHALTFTSDSKELLCSGDLYQELDDKRPRSSRIIDVATGAERLWVGHHTGSVHAAAISVDGKLAITGGGHSGEAVVWNTSNGRIVRRLQSKGNAIASLGWSADGETIAWASLKDQFEPNGKYTLEWTFRFSELSTAVAAKESKFTSAIQTSKGRTLKQLDDRIVVFTGNDEGASFAPTGEVFGYSWLNEDMYVVACEKGLFLVNPENGIALRRFEGHLGKALCIAPFAERLIFATGGADHTIRIWTAERSEPLLSLLPVGDEWIAWTSHGVFACSSAGDRLMGWQLDDNRERLGNFSPAALFRTPLYQPEVIRHVVSAGGLDEAFVAAKVKKPDVFNIAQLLTPRK
jgi:WD40 repeat protein